MFSLHTYCFRKYVMTAVDDHVSNFTNYDSSMEFHFFNYTKKNLASLVHRKKLDKSIWLIYFHSTTKTINVVLEEFENILLNFDDDFIVALNQDDKIVLWELYRIGPMSPIQSNIIADWTAAEGLKITSICKWERRSNLLGYNFKITNLVDEYYTTKIEMDEIITGKYNLQGSLVDLLNLFANAMNFTYTYVPPPDNAWGSLQKDGSWNGMVNLVLKEVVDFCKYYLK